MSIGTMICSILAAVFGACIVVYGGYDDSPGAQGLGLFIALMGVRGIIKSRKKNPDQRNSD